MTVLLVMFFAAYLISNVVKAVIRKLIYRFMTRLDNSVNSIINDRLKNLSFCASLESEQKMAQPVKNIIIYTHLVLLYVCEQHLCN